MILINGTEVQFEKFPNNETKLVHDSLLTLAKKGTISFKYEDDSDLIKLLMLKNYLDEKYRNIIEKYELLIYYMPYSRQDRVEDDSPFTLRYISDFINYLGFNKVSIIEPHSDVSSALLRNSISININAKLLPEVLKEINFDRNNDYLVFPDVTANKRYGNLGDFKTLTGLKKRDFKTGRITNLELAGIVDKKGFKALLIDDLSSYGGTFLLTAEKLKELGASEIYLLVGHCENSIFDGDFFKVDLIKKVFTTDTILTKQNDWSNMKIKERIKIFNIEELLYETKNEGQ